MAPYSIVEINPKTGISTDKYAFKYKSTVSISKYRWIMRNYNCVFIEENYDRPLRLTKNITVLIFCSRNRFNYFLRLTKIIIRVHFGNNFNKMLELPKSTETLNFGDFYDQPIVLSKQLKRVVFGSNFNQAFDSSKQLISLIFDTGEEPSFNQKLILPKIIKNLRLNYECKQPLILTKNLTTLLICGSYHSLSTFDPCPNIKDLYLISSDNCPLLDNIPESVKSLSCLGHFNYVPANFPNKWNVIHHFYGTCDGCKYYSLNVSRKKN